MNSHYLGRQHDIGRTTGARGTEERWRTAILWARGTEERRRTAILWSQANVAKSHGLAENVFLLHLKMKTAIASSAGRARTLSVKCVS